MARTMMVTSTAVLLAIGCSNTGSVSAAAVKPAAQRKAAPDFTLKDEMGRAVKLSDFKGKVVLLNFWATWCSPCKAEIPWFVEFQQRHKDAGLVVLGVSMDDEGWKVVRPFVSEMKMNYRVVIGDDAMAQLYGGVDSLPTSFMVDREGRIAAVHVGLVGKDIYQNDINQLLATERTAARAAVPAVVVPTK